MKVSVISLVIFTALAVGPALAEGDVKKGEKVFKKCKTCHQVGEEAKNKIGPLLNDIFGRVAGSNEDFKYSKAMKAKGAEGLTWTDETLGQYLIKPKKFVKGTKMAFPGLRKEKDRENVLAYLKTFSPDAASE